jgi:hypothetical protein
MRRILAGVVALFLAATSAFAQSGASVRQSGASVTPNSVPYWVTNGVIGGGATAADSPITSFGVTSTSSAASCVNSGRATSPAWISICQGFVSGVPTISVQNNGSASPQPLQFIVNGTTYPFPGALAGITINSTALIGGTLGNCLTVGSSVVAQTPCSIITAPTTGSGSVVFNTSPTLIGTISGSLTFPGNQTFSGNNLYSGQSVFTGTSFPSQSIGNTLIGGTVAAPTLTANSQAYLYNTAANGAVIQGLGTLYDVVLANKAGTPVLEVPTGQTNVTIPSGFTLSGLSSGSCTNGLGLNASNQAITVSCPGAASSIQVGTTTISSGSSGNIEFNNVGVLGELTPNGGVVKSSSNLQADPNYSGFATQNCSLTASVAGSNLTIALKDNAGNDPSATSPCNINFRNVTIGTGSTSSVTVTAATSFTVNAGSTFGITNTAATCSAASSCPFRLWVTAINNAGTVVLGAVALTNASGVLPLNEGNVASATACNACGTAATLGTMYATTTQTSKAFRILGYLDWGSGLATAGTYASGPTLIVNMGPGIKKPGDTIQTIIGTSSGTASTTSSTYGTGAAPANAPNVAITMTATPNLIRAHFTGNEAVSSTVTEIFCQMARGPSGALNNQFGVQAIINNSAASSVTNTAVMQGFDTPGTLTQQFYTVRARNTNGSTNVSCPVLSGETLELSEIMG